MEGKDSMENIFNFRVSSDFFLKGGLAIFTAFAWFQSSIQGIYPGYNSFGLGGV